jgi:N-acetylglutamate synthase-like GNAT family acetyltransferase
MNIREANLNDAEGIASVQVKAWQSAYDGVMPKEYLDTLSIKEKTGEWSRSLAKENPGICLVIEINNKIIGFCVFGPARDNDLKMCNAGELVALNILPNYWSKGYGSEILKFILAESKEKKWEALYLWVLKKNMRARSVYEHYDFLQEGKEKIEKNLTGHKLHEIRYVLKL